MPSKKLELLYYASNLSKSLIFLTIPLAFLNCVASATFTIDRANMDAYASGSGVYPYDPNRGTYGGIPYGQSQSIFPYRGGSSNPYDGYDTNREFC